MTPTLTHLSEVMDAAYDLDEDDELLAYDFQRTIQELCQRENLTGSGRSEALKLAVAIKQGDMSVLEKLRDFPEAFSQVDECGWYPLHRAAVQPLVLVLETVLYASFSLTLEEKTSEGETFLTLAVKAGLVENVKMLLDHGASPHTTNSKNESPLLLAVRARSHATVSRLIAGGARVEQVCLKKWTAMHEASRVGCVRVMELLLQEGGRVSETDQYGVTPLGTAAEYGHSEVMELLIKHGADVNDQAPNGDSVLYDAAGSGNPDCINILLLHGANPNIHNLSSQLPVHHAAYKGHILALRILIPITTRRALRLSGHSPLHSAADGGHTLCLELLLQRGFDVNALLSPHISDNYGDMRRSPLYFAVSNGDATCTELLLKSGAMPDLDPLRCLLVAVRSGRYKIVELLLAAKADVNCYFTAVSDTLFPTALQYCLKDEVMMRLLLNNGYDAEKCFCCNHDEDWDDLSESGYSQDQEEKIAFCDFVSVSCLVNLVGRIVTILLEYVGQVSLCGKLTKILEKHKEWPHILWTTCNPRSLSHLSRVVIRKHLSCSGLMSLHLPNRLKDFLLFKENDLYAQIICRED
ncbi:ankyrin repeat and SOCS box protein 15-like [Centropristis striata]|uniref:ankyrin repeat and SOCS box protein 15-like n=1 Tax=Centropristis striata TaxID=184440 RepID=UPI0027DFBF73|nr:ankyrin repeat and SOCS box protein 15-like [Centropristis striata]